MEKEKLLSTLTEKIGKTSFSPQTIEAYADLNPVAEGSEPDDAYFEKATAFFTKMQGQFNADMAAKVEDFKKNYKPSTPPDGEQGKGEKSDLEKRIEQMEEKFRESAASAARATIVKEAVSKGKSLKVANDAIWEDSVKSVEIGENDSAETVVTKAKAHYEKQLRRIMGEGAAPYGGSGRQGGSKDADKDKAALREAFKDKMRRAGKLPKKEN